MLLSVFSTARLRLVLGGGHFLYLPAITAALTGTHAISCLLQFLTLRTEDFDDQRGNGKENPFDWEPPPTDEDPPSGPMMLVFQLSARNDLNVDISAFALWANNLCRNRCSSGGRYWLHVLGRLHIVRCHILQGYGVRRALNGRERVTTMRADSTPIGDFLFAFGTNNECHICSFFLL